MPLDRNAIRDQANQALIQMLEGRQSKTQSGVDAIKQQILDSRSNFLKDTLTPYSSGALTASQPLYTNRLNRQLGGNLDTFSQKMNLDRNILLSQEAMRQAEQGMAQRTQGEDFNRQQGLLTSQENFDANQSQLERNSKERQMATANDYAMKGIASNYNMANDYISQQHQQALYRSLAGLGGSGATAGLLYAYGQPAKPEVTLHNPQAKLYTQQMRSIGNTVNPQPNSSDTISDPMAFGGL